MEERNRTVTLEKQASHIPPTNLVNYGEGTELRLKDGVQECLDKLMVFALPSMEKPEVLIIPVEYALMGGPSTQRGSALSLASSLRNYTMKMLRKISKYYRISSSLSGIERYFLKASSWRLFDLL